VGKLFVKTMEVGMLGTNCYLVMDDSDREGFIIDPGAEARKIIDAASQTRLDCKAILCTHGHMDHVGAVGKVAEAIGAPVMISKTDSGILEGAVHGIVGKIGFIVGQSVFCGDLVFQGSIGRTDLRGGSMSQLLESVRKYIWVMPGDTVIYPGHGPSTTIRAEKARNPYLRDLEPEV
jgi:hydroxyacylglutathione hydrolase